MVNQKILETAKRGVILLATADDRGDVHAAAVGRIEAPGENRLTIHEWLCPKTLGNLQNNGRGTLIIWDAAAEDGYQLPVHVENVNAEAVMDGYVPEMEARGAMPQEEYELEVTVEYVYELRQKPHTDRPES